MDDSAFLSWIESYERAWRAPGTEALAALFSPDAVYLTSPYAEPVDGLAAIRRLWEAEREGPDEVFTMTAEVVAISGMTGVARVEVDYGRPVRQSYRDLWVVSFGAGGRADRFEEWPFWPSHGATPGASAPVVVDASDVDAAPWREVLRSGALSAGVYALGAGATDYQRPHGQDEVYVVLQGAAELEIDGRATPVGAGTVAFVPARMSHRFQAIMADLRVAVVFAPPEQSAPADQ